MSNWKLLNQYRLSPKHDPIFGTPPEAGFNGMFCLILNGLKIKVIASDSEGWQHVSVSIAGSTMTPSWSVMCQIKDLFWEPEDWVCQFHPAASEYVNYHPGTLHLWRPLKEKLPTPPHLMVGVRDEADIEKINNDPKYPFKFVKIA